MEKMSKIWVATATLIFPNTSHLILFTKQQIIDQIDKLWNTHISLVMLEKHLVSFENRQYDKGHPSRGGSRNRYLFRTSDGFAPDDNGSFRLYKGIDGQYDGKDKTGPYCPLPSKVDPQFQYLIGWYQANYF
jgi:hypothetical protein